MSPLIDAADWVANKDTQPYDVWTAVVRAASPMHADRRATAPRSSNLVEGDHPEDNRNIGTRLNAGVFVSRCVGRRALATA
jgi:hypothetical protein